MYRTIAEIVFWEFDSIIMQNVRDILPLFGTPTWSEKQEFSVFMSHDLLMRLES